MLISICRDICMLFFPLTILLYFRWLCWVFIAVWIFSSCSEQSLNSSCGVCVSLQWLLVAEQGLSSCGAGLVALQHVGSSWTRDWIHVSCIGRWILYHRAMREAPMYVFFVFLLSYTKCSTLYMLLCTLFFPFNNISWKSPHNQFIEIFILNFYGV